MPVVSCKCPNCDGGMVFSPEKQLFVCEYCGTVATSEQMEQMAKSQSADSSPDEPSDPDSFDAQGYYCPSCGAEIFTDDLTAASFCYYCHNPVMLAGRLSGALRPDKVIPFVVRRQDAEQQFLSWCKRKWFLRKNFYSSFQLEKMTGVYFPFWLADVTIDCQLKAGARDTRVWRVGDTQHTETSVYDIEREGSVSLFDIEFPGINREDVEIARKVFPFDHTRMKDFSMSYLSGFQAEKRGLESASLESSLLQLSKDHAHKLMRDTIVGHSGITVKSHTEVQIGRTSWRYVLLPVWTLTGSFGGQIYYFALNGQTGKVCGSLPTSKARLAVLGVSVAMALAGVILAIGGLMSG